MPWSLAEYGSVVTKFLAGCSKEMLDAFDARASILVDRGNACRYPVSEHLQDGIYELRVRAGNNESRFLYYFGEHRTIVFVSAFFKKTRKTPAGETRRAIQKRAAIKSEEEVVHGFRQVN